MSENLAILSRFYYRPAKAAGDALDRGSLAFAVCAAALAVLVWMFGAGAPVPARAVVAIFLGMLPLSIVIVAKWDGLGSPGAVLRREYVSLLVCALFAWTAAYLPFGALQFLFLLSGLYAAAPVLAALAHFVFLVLFRFCLRIALGTTMGHAIVATIVAWIAGLVFVIAFPGLGRLSYLLLSPWVLFLLYRYYASDVRALGQVMSSRQNFRRQLEASMLNPRDADAHYQLGLIYQQRRQYADAAASFLRAVEIQPEEADARLQLGRVLRAQGRHEEARHHIELALKTDSGVGRQEGWRELGAVLLDLGLPEAAIAPLERYTSHRSYDPEGLFYLASAFKRTGRASEARDAFQQTIEAVQTAPPYRRGLLRRWAGEARSELKTLAR